MDITLEPSEVQLLEELLRSAIMEQRMEIADTDSITFKEELRRRKDVLEELYRKVTGKKLEE